MTHSTPPTSSSSTTAPAPTTTTATPASSTSSIPSNGQASHLSEQPQIKQGLLLIRVVEARNVGIPPASLSQAQANQQANPQAGGGKAWWLPYVVLEFDRNELQIDALGGEVSNPVWKYRANFDVSRESEVLVSLYMRTSPNSTEVTGTSGGHVEDVFLGVIKILPSFVDQRVQDDWYPLVGGSGHMRVQMCFKVPVQNVPLSIDAFDLLKVLGKGSFGKVMQVRKRDTNRIYAMKIIRKSRIVARSEVSHTLAERTVLARINHPFIVPLKFSFQTPEKLYLVLAFVNGGELFHHLQRDGRFDERRSRFYTAELLCALECLHRYDIIYRDLKPENILLDYNGHIALCDFGLCKLNMGAEVTTNTFCGTPEYLAPELLYGQGYTKVVDWWTLGVLLYEMLTGLPPFYDENTNEMYRKILQDELRFPEEIGLAARSLLSGLLTRDPSRRLGAGGAEEVKQHPFFAAIDWGKLLMKKYQPPFKPAVASAMDTSNFDREFTDEVPLDSVVDDSHLSETVQQQFAGFTYDASEGGALSLASTMQQSSVGRSG
ncbi:MAG: kinase-like domain-containing protein [Piptocephalis tieghemiana]|nr:MAG: kinase-like domain-containing protein [Piptocephalis tieghemiana]